MFLNVEFLVVFVLVIVFLFNVIEFRRIFIIKFVCFVYGIVYGRLNKKN